MENNSVHIHVFKDTVVEPTCKERGYTLHRCECGYEHRDNYTPITDHSYEQIEGTGATCTEGGEHRFKCRFCGEIKTEAVAPLGHNWSKWNIEKFATCTEEGEEIRCCSRCGAVERRSVKAKGHKLTNPKRSKTEKGVVEYFCLNCGETVKLTSGARFKRFIKKNLIWMIAVALILAMGVVSLFIFDRQIHYALGKHYMEKGDYTKAYYHLKDSVRYKDSEELLENFSVIYGSEKTTILDEEGNKTGTRESKYDKNGNLILYYAEYGELSQKTEYEYDKNDNKISEAHYSNGELECRFEYEYDEKDNLLLEIQYDSDGNIISKLEKEYDEYGNCIKSSGGSYEAVYKYEYDSNGNITLKSTYKNGILTFDERYEDGRAVYKTEYDDTGEISNEHEYRYVDDEQITVYSKDYRRVRDEDDYGDRDIIYEEYYDDEGNLYRSIDYYIYYEDDEIDHESISEYQYDIYGKKVYYKSAYTSYDEYGDVESAWFNETEYEYDEDGKNLLLEVQRDEDGNEDRRCEYSYDQKGNIVSSYKKEYGKVKEDLTRKYKYDEYDNILIESHFDEYDEEILRYEREYDESGKVMLLEVEYVEGKETLRTEYDEKGNKISSVGKEDGETVENTFTYEYDDYGNIILKITFDGDGNETEREEWSYEYEFNEDGDVTRVVKYDANGDYVDSVYYFEYEPVCEFDGDGRVISETYLYADGDVYQKTEYTYNKKGDLTLELTLDENGKVYSKTEYTYNKNGDLTLMITVDKEGNVVSKRENTYNENGDPTLEISTENGKETYRCEYTYNKKGCLTLMRRYNSEAKLVYEEKHDEYGILVSVMRIDAYYNQKETTTYSDPIIRYEEDDKEDKTDKEDEDELIYYKF